MSLSPEIPEHYIDSGAALDAYVAQLSSESDHKECAVDTEADSMHSYETKLCLIQFAVPGELAIIDPLGIGIEGMEGFVQYLKGRDVIWMHGADYDMAMFRKTFDWVPDCVWDTQTAARLLGVEKYGLAALLEQEFGVHVSKQSQKADWSKRPLTSKMLDYAYNDVRYLLEMGNNYVQRLKDQGRFDWFTECCDAAKENVLLRDEKDFEEQWRINGYGKLERKGLAFLRALWHWRDEECRKLDRPAFKLMGNADLLDLCRKLQKGERVEPPRYLRPAFARRLLKAISEARKIPEKEFPQKRLKKRGMRLEIDEEKFFALRSKRDQVCEELGIDPTLVSTRLDLEKLASQTMAEEEKAQLLMRWQRELLEL